MATEMIVLHCDECSGKDFRLVAYETTENPLEMVAVCNGCQRGILIGVNRPRMYLRWRELPRLYTLAIEEDRKKDGGGNGT